MNAQMEIKKLRGDLSGISGCPACGYAPGGAPVFFIDIDADATNNPPASPCPKCGHTPKGFTLKIGDKPIKTYRDIDDGDEQSEAR